MVAVCARKFMRATCPVTNPPRCAKSQSPAFARRACSASPTSGAARVAQRPDQHGREDGGVDLVAHGIGHRKMQRVALQSEVEGVTADVAGGFQPGRERELTGLARVGARQQPMLDLGRERQRNRALAPRKEVGEPAVGDDDIRKRVRGKRNIGHRPLVRFPGKAYLEHTDGFPAVGYGREHANSAGAVFDLDRLRDKRAAVRSSRQKHPLGGLPTLRPLGRLTAGVAEPDQRVAAEIRDEEGNLARTQCLHQALAEHVGGSDRGRVLDGRKQLPEVQSRRVLVRHRPSLRGRSCSLASLRSRPRSAPDMVFTR